MCLRSLLLPKSFGSFFFSPMPQQSLLHVVTWKFPKHTHVPHPHCHLPWLGSLVWFLAMWQITHLPVVLPAHEFWVSCFMYGIDLTAFNLLSKAYSSVFNQYQGGKLKWLKTVRVASGCITASRNSATTTSAGQ